MKKTEAYRKVSYRQLQQHFCKLWIGPPANNFQGVLSDQILYLTIPTIQ